MRNKIVKTLKPCSQLLAGVAMAFMVTVVPYQGAKSNSNTATSNVPVVMSFQQIVTTSGGTPINFGTVGVNTSEKSYTISPAGVVTSSDGGIVVANTGASAGSISFEANSGAGMTVEAGDLSAASSGGVSLSDPVCSYNGIALACVNGATASTAVVDGQRDIAIGVTATVAANISDNIEASALQIPITVTLN